ncbi:hypothetical protein BT63DRAFT_476429 [Microthyrium microscopicum]|uniref:Heterokaryon incompatibility domain-containing protein n=1 Tax=Microthyrium microscopicum TaxID=703497 RepID=A0A6A6UQD5_9PEZI|nr:hypothetical protein BT63DRAFT_476429 [Microthyrium microscopicum]
MMSQEQKSRETKGRRRSLSFSWILYGHIKISSVPVPLSLKSSHESHSINQHPPQRPFQNAQHEIRILHLQPGEWSEPIVTKLETISSPYDVPYEALSYTWGSATDTKPITVDGSEYHVTRNLEAALRHLRLTDETRKLWCDSVCINQMDNIEKSIQVQKMGHIFSGASMVLVWLGKSYENQDQWSLDVDEDLLKKAIDLASNLRQAYDQSLHDDPFQWASLLRQRVQDLQLCHAESNGDGRVTALLINLLGRPYAHYLAILQDFFGDEYGHPSPDFLFPPFYWQDLQFVIRHPSFKALSKAYRLQVLLSMTSASFHCSDPRDRIYALLGLSNNKNNGQSTVTVDYLKTFQTVALDTAISLIEGTQSFALLSFAPDTTPGMPSWVPAWNRPVIYTRKETYFDDYFAILTCFPGRHAARFQLSPDRMTLYASGVILGAVASVVKLPDLTMPDDDTVSNRATKNIELMKRFEERLLTIPSLAKCFELSREDISILGHVLEGTRYNWTWEEDVQRYDAIMDRLPEGMKSISELEMGKYLDALAFVAKGDTIFSTAQQDIGRTLLGPVGDSPLEADCIALFPGCLRPVLLRPVTGGYRNLGQCYLHGYMDMDEQAAVFEKALAEQGKLAMIALL